MIAPKSAVQPEELWIERMREEHLTQVQELERRCYSTPWSWEAFENELRNPATVYLIARIGNQIIGYGGMWLVVDEAHITTLAVDPLFRGRKIGEWLLHMLIEVAIARGMERATLEVRASNMVAQNLYRKYGFRGVAFRKAYYSDNKEDALIMWLEEMQSNEMRERMQALRAKLGS